VRESPCIIKETSKLSSSLFLPPPSLPNTVLVQGGVRCGYTGLT